MATVLLSFFLQEFKKNVDVMDKSAAEIKVILFFIVFDLKLCC